jgi:outer membrane receptor protein involved in Fe transport
VFVFTARPSAACFAHGCFAGRRRWPVVAGAPVDAPFTVLDASKKLGYTASFYVQDEWRITNWLILSSGLRYDQYWAYMSENQFSPRFSLTWKPFNTTTFHAGYARTFTPPEQVLAAPTNLALVQNTTEQPSVPFGDPVRAERADIYDVGVVQQCCRDWRSASTPTTRRPPT